jgi:hypothetical protein
MKAYLITLIIVMAFTCWLNGGGEPYPYPVGISGVKQTAYSVKRQAGSLAELNFVDKPRNSAFITRIDENPGDQEEQIVDFPLDARN